MPQYNAVKFNGILVCLKLACTRLYTDLAGQNGDCIIQDKYVAVISHFALSITYCRLLKHFFIDRCPFWKGSPAYYWTTQKLPNGR